jgi:hypothetical protein
LRHEQNKMVCPYYEHHEHNKMCALTARLILVINAKNTKKKHYNNVLLVTYCQLQRISHGHMCFYKSQYRFCYTYHVVFMSIITVLPRIKKEAEVENKNRLKNKLATRKISFQNGV